MFWLLPLCAFETFHNTRVTMTGRAGEDSTGQGTPASLRWKWRPFPVIRSRNRSALTKLGSLVSVGTLRSGNVRGQHVAIGSKVGVITITDSSIRVQRSRRWFLRPGILGDRRCEWITRVSYNGHNQEMKNRRLRSNAPVQSDVPLPKWDWETFTSRLLTGKEV